MSNIKQSDLYQMGENDTVMQKKILIEQSFQKSIFKKLIKLR